MQRENQLISFVLDLSAGFMNKSKVPERWWINDRVSHDQSPEADSKGPVEWTATGALLLARPKRLFHASLNRRGEMRWNHLIGSNSNLRPEAYRLVLQLRAALGSISVGQSAGLIYRACQNNFLHLPPMRHNYVQCLAHHTDGTWKGRGSSAWGLK